MTDSDFAKVCDKLLAGWRALSNEEHEGILIYLVDVALTYAQPAQKDWLIQQVAEKYREYGAAAEAEEIAGLLNKVRAKREAA